MLPGAQRQVVPIRTLSEVMPGLELVVIRVLWYDAVKFLGTTQIKRMNSLREHVLIKSFVERVQVSKVIKVIDSEFISQYSFDFRAQKFWVKSKTLPGIT